MAPPSTTNLERLLRHSDWLTGLARRLVGDAATAEDLVQDTWVAALRNPPDPARPAQPWLAGVVRRLASLRRRRGARRADPPVNPVAPAAALVAERVEQERRLAREVLKLEPPYRDTVLLRYYQGLSAAKIGRMTGVPAATVRTRLRRGLERLRERLDEEAGDRRTWIQALGPLSGWKTAQITGGVSVVGGLIMGKVAVGSLVVAALALLVWFGVRSDESEDPAPIVGDTEAQLVAEQPEVEYQPTPPPLDDASRQPVVDEIPGERESVTLDSLAALTIRAVAKDTRDPLERVRVSVAPVQPGGGYSLSWAEGERGRLNELVTTSAEGVAEFDLQPEQALRVRLEGEDLYVGTIEVTIEPLTAGEQRELSVEVPTGPDLHFVGRLVDEADEPVRDARVVVPDSHGPVVNGKRVRSYAETKTDPQGFFSFDGLSWARQKVEIDVPGFGLTLVALTTGHERKETAQIIRLLRASSIEAVVTAEAGTSVEGVTLHVTTNFSNLIRPRTGANRIGGINPKWTAEMGQGRRFALAGLPPGVPLSVELRRGGVLVKLIAEDLHLVPGEHRVLEVTLSTGAVVGGVALDHQHHPVAGLEVWLVPTKKRHQRPGTKLPRYFTGADRKSAKRATTDVEGQFTFEGVTPGPWHCGPAHVEVEGAPTVSALVAPFAQAVHVEPDWGPRDLVIEVTRGLFIEGRVLDSDGSAIGPCWVRLESERTYRNPDFLADDTGRFVVGPLVPGEVELWSFGRGRFGNSPRVRATPGDTDVILRLVAAATISGRIIDPETGEGCRAELRLIDSAKPLGYVRWKSSERETGTFELEKLPTGTYHLLARADDGGIGLLRNLSVKTGEARTDVELRLERGAVLVVRSGDDSEASFSLRHEGLAVGHGFIGAGKVSQQTLFPGVTRVHYRGASEVEVEVELTPGERRELVLPPEE